MPELANRDDTEKKIIGELEPIFEAQFRRALTNPSNVPYAAFEADLTRVMTAELRDVFQQAGVALLLDNAVVVSAGMFRGTAQQWAAGFAPELAREVVSTSQELVQAALASSSGDARRISDALATIFMSDARLEAVAATECTRATSAGEHAAVFFYDRSGKPRLVPVWRTARDARVCDRCAPLAGRSRDYWGSFAPMGPPMHPVCRCWLEWLNARVWAAA
ncbi:MAG TPA: phage minor head protein [Pirellulales bacterium]|nr:phage minor head protein [Pirellulales bacterium]